ncbi:MAG: hypothetical protein Q4D90_05575 [bacterium]|nr:hypothetical protein [bacterium]
MQRKSQWGYYAMGVLMLCALLLFSGCGKKNNGAAQSTSKSESTQSMETRKETESSTNTEQKAEKESTKDDRTEAEKESKEESTGVLDGVVKDVEDGMDNLTTGTTEAR